MRLCALCASEKESTVSLQESVFFFMLAKSARVALPKMSAVERGALTLQLIFAGGLQHDACRCFIFKELCPPYCTTVLARQAHEIYFGLADRVEVPEDNDENVAVSLARWKKCLLPLHFFLRNGGDAQKLQPPVDFRGKDAVNLLSALVRLWCTASLRPPPHLLSLGELPPGLATYIALHHPAHTLRLLQTTVVTPSVPYSWREMWQKIFFSSCASDNIVRLLHTILNQGDCAKFWHLTLCALVYPLLGIVADSDEIAVDQQATAFDGPSIFVTYAMFCLWLGEIKRETIVKDARLSLFPFLDTVEAEESPNCVTNAVAAATASALGSCCRCALAYGLHLVEKDDAGCSASGDNQWKQAQARVVQAAYGLLLSLYNGHSIASQYVRSALDHPEPTIFVPSFADLDEKEGGNQWGDYKKNCCGGLTFITAVALRLPVVQLYIAERIWCLLESMVASDAGDAREAQRAELDARLQVLLNSHAFSGLTPFALRDPKVRGDGLRRTLRLKRARDDEEPQLCCGDKCSSRACENKGDASALYSDISLASFLLCNALFDFVVEEFVQLPAMTHSPVSVSAPATTLNGRSFENGMRLMLVTPLHMKSLLTLAANTPPLSSSSSSSSLSSLSPLCFAALHNVCCILMSVLLYRNCVSLRQWLSCEESNDCRIAVTTRLLGCIRRWLRFFAPLGVYRYSPVAEVLLPECLRGMEEDERMAVAGGLRAAAPQNTALKEFCGAVRAVL